jgi:hypothetical protein
VLILRIVVILAALFLLGLGVAFAITRNRRYLRIAWRTLQAIVVLLVAFGLLYLFSRVLMVI